ncbi:alpha/beta-hydrolase, partial [Aureobasidium melanogenum]
MSRSDIEFKTIDNVTLRGWMFMPADAEGKHPCLIITHGLTCLKEMCLDTLAERLTSVLPIACLVYDHRGYGASDQKENEPRNEIVPAHQNSDLQDAITYAQSCEDIDAAKIGLWGYSYSGGHSLWVAANDRRVKAVIAVAPFITGDIIANNMRSDLEDSFIEMLSQGMNPLDTAVLPHVESYAFFSTWAEKSDWKNDLTIRRHVMPLSRNLMLTTSYSLEGIQSYFPGSRIHRIGPTPLLMQVPKKDAVAITDTMLEAYNRAVEPKEIQILPVLEEDVACVNRLMFQLRLPQTLTKVPIKPYKAYGREVWQPPQSASKSLRINILRSDRMVRIPMLAEDSQTSIRIRICFDSNSLTSLRYGRQVGAMSHLLVDWLYFIIMQDFKGPQAFEARGVSSQQPEAMSTSDTPSIPTWRLILLILSLCVGLFLSLLDTSIVATALYDIGTSFSSPHTVTWVALSYTLSYLSFAVPFANLSDVIGRRAAWLLAFMIFFVFSLACGFAKTLVQLIGFRAVQGVGGSGLYSLTMIVMPEIVTEGKRKWIGAVVGLVVAVAGVTGPVVGGIITMFATWRWVFWINGPIAAVSVVLFLLTWPADDMALSSLSLHPTLACWVFLLPSCLHAYSNAASTYLLITTLTGLGSYGSRVLLRKLEQYRCQGCEQVLIKKEQDEHHSHLRTQKNANYEREKLHC